MRKTLLALAAVVAVVTVTGAAAQDDNNPPISTEPTLEERLSAVESKVASDAKRVTALKIRADDLTARVDALEASTPTIPAECSMPMLDYTHPRTPHGIDHDGLVLDHEIVETTEPDNTTTRTLVTTITTTLQCDGWPSVLVHVSGPDGDGQTCYPRTHTQRIAEANPDITDWCQTHSSYGSSVHPDYIWLLDSNGWALYDRDRHD